MPPLHELSALTQASLIARRELSVEELVRHHLARIDALDGALNAFVELRPEAALRRARALDKVGPSAGGRLWGVPTGMKDLHFTRGFFVRAGSRSLRGVWSPFDDRTSADIARAGLVVLGKLATSELGILPIVETGVHPPTRNPWDLTRSAGGSSGGSGAAVAAGLIPLAPASDGGGSIRLPAAFNGLVGIKPSRGLVPNPFRNVERLELSVVGPHARDLDDATALLDVLIGRDGPDSLSTSTRRPPDPLRVIVLRDSPLGPVDPAVLLGLDRVARALEDLGHHLEPAPPLVGALDEFLPMFDFLAAGARVPLPWRLEPLTRWLRARGKRLRPERALAVRELFARRVERWLGSADLALLPTAPCLPPEVGRWAALPPAEKMAAVAPLGAFTAAFNAGGQPAVSLPVWHTNALGLPVGVQLVAPFGEDRRLIAAARAVMDALGEGPRVARPGD